MGRGRKEGTSPGDLFLVEREGRQEATIAPMRIWQGGGCAPRPASPGSCGLWDQTHGATVLVDRVRERRLTSYDHRLRAGLEKSKSCDPGYLIPGMARPGDVPTSAYPPSSSKKCNLTVYFPFSSMLDSDPSRPASSSLNVPHRPKDV